MKRAFLKFLKKNIKKFSFFCKKNCFFGQLLVDMTIFEWYNVSVLKNLQQGENYHGIAICKKRKSDQEI